MRLLSFFASRYPGRSLLVLGCLLVSAVLDLIGLGTWLPVLDVALQSAPDTGEVSGVEARIMALIDSFGVPRELGPLLVFLVAVSVARAAILLVSKSQVGYTVAHVTTDLRLGLLQSLLGARWTYFTRQPLGAIANSMAQETQRASYAYYYLAQILTNGVQAAIAIALALAISWKATLCALGAGILGMIVLSSFVRMAARGGRRQTTVMRSLLTRLTDSLQAVKLLKAMGREPLIEPLLADDARRLNKAQRKVVFGKEGLRAVQDPFQVAFAASALFAFREVLGMEPAETLLLLGLFIRSLNGLNRTQRKYQVMKTDESALFSLLEMIESAEREREELHGGEEPSLETGVTLDAVDLEYDGRPVLQGAEIEIRAREVTAIVGGSGAGKTTIIDLITGLIVPNAGTIRLDGRPLEEVDVRRWREQIGYVPQELLLMHDSVRMNVTLGDPALSDADVERALRDADAWDYVSKLPEGIESSVGERGSLLSGGQRQRVAIARALAHGPKLLILDEATTALDPDSEQAVLETIAKLRGKTTVVAISHQPALTRIADRVYRVEQGQVHLAEQPVAAAHGLN